MCVKYVVAFGSVHSSGLSLEGPVPTDFTLNDRNRNETAISDLRLQISEGAGVTSQVPERLVGDSFNDPTRRKLFERLQVHGDSGAMRLRGNRILDGTAVMEQFRATHSIISCE